MTKIRPLTKIWLLLLSALLPLGTAGISLAQGTAGEPADDESQAAADLELVSALERVVARAIQRAERSVVSIARTSKHVPDESGYRDTMPGQGRLTGVPGSAQPSNPSHPDFIPDEFATGVIVGKGQVLTNFHVLGDPTENSYWVTTHDHHVFRMKFDPKGADGRSDLAVLEVDDPGAVHEGDFAPMTFGDGSKLKKGEIVIALGNPYAIARDGQVSASWGIVANLSRKAAPPLADPQDPEKLRTLHHYGTLIQTDARLNLGTSGGALVNLRGEMVGLTTSRAALAGFEQAAGYAIPVDETFLRVLDALKKGEEIEYGLLGVVPRRPTDRLHHPVDGLRRQPGVLVTDTRKGLPAWTAGLKEDDLITHVDGHPIHEPDGLRLHVGKLPVGATTTLTVVRDGRTYQFPVVLSKFQVKLKQIVTKRADAWRGLRVEYASAVDSLSGDLILEPRNRPDLGGFDGTYVAVSAVEADSPAARAGLKRGSLVSHVGTTPIETPDDFRRAVAEKVGAVKLSVLRPTGRIEVVTIEADER